VVILLYDSCKLFFMVDSEWKERGVGMLYLKPCGEKTQLLIRSDTTTLGLYRADFVRPSVDKSTLF